MESGRMGNVKLELYSYKRKSQDFKFMNCRVRIPTSPHNHYLDNKNMLENIEIELKTWNWKWQTVWDTEKSISIASILSRLESWYYQTKDVEIDLSVIDLSIHSFEMNDLFEFITHYQLTKNADLTYPVIIDKRGRILDGRHRLCKAIIEWNKKLKWIMILDSDII